LQFFDYRITLSYMSTSLTIRLDDQLSQSLDQAATGSGRSRSEVVRDALRRQLAILALDEVREQLIPLAEAHGWLTDEDVFRDLS
jgi:predicted transcriptional regulator